LEEIFRPQKNPPVPVFQKLDESAVFTKELAKNLARVYGWFFTL
jgi:hypothetical protein